jgi:hypothetical protein
MRDSQTEQQTLAQELRKDLEQILKLMRYCLEPDDLSGSPPPAFIAP